MTSQPMLDLAGADATRRDMLRDLAGTVDADILRALHRPDTPDRLLARPFHVVADWNQLTGPARPPLPVPAPWQNHRLPATVTDEADLTDLYHHALLHGTAAEQAAVLHPHRLTDRWEELADRLPAAVTTVWQTRFPHLTRARRP